MNLGNADLSKSGCWPGPAKLQNLLHVARVNSVKSKFSRRLIGLAELERALGNNLWNITVSVRAGTMPEMKVRCEVSYLSLLFFSVETENLGDDSLTCC